MITLSATRVFKGYHYEVPHNLSKNVIYFGVEDWEDFLTKIATSLDNFPQMNLLFTRCT